MNVFVFLIEFMNFKWQKRGCSVKIGCANSLPAISGFTHLRCENSAGTCEAAKNRHLQMLIPKKASLGFAEIKQKMEDHGMVGP